MSEKLKNVLGRIREAKKSKGLDPQLTVDTLEAILESMKKNDEITNDVFGLKEKRIQLQDKYINLLEKETEQLTEFSKTMAETMLNFIKEDDARLKEFILYLFFQIMEAKEQTKEQKECS